MGESIFRELVKEKYELLSPGQKKVATYITENLEECVFKTAQQLGKKADVSETTVIRLSYALGFLGFSDLQAYIQKEFIQLKGSPFQIKVWEALLSIPEGHLVSYQDIALSIEKPKAMRATASAIAKNNIAYLIPCHRVIRQNGNFGQYRWQSSRKKAMILWENCKNVSIK